MKQIILLLVIVIGHLMTAQKKEKLDSLFKKMYANKEFNGNILIAEKGVVTYKNSFGLANEKTKEKLNENSIFELASVSKQFTAFAIVILKEKGKLKYDDEIGKYIPELAFYKNVTIENLLHHTSGLPDYMPILDSILIDSTWDNKTKIATNKDIISVYANHKPKLLFEPNTKWQYSNTGYALLASIIEKVSKKTFADFLQDNIFKPLQMSNTFVYTRRSKPIKINNYAFGYVYSDSLKSNVLPDAVPRLDLMVYCLDGIVGDGTVNSTIIDLLKWDRALYKNTLISKKSREKIFTNGTLIDNKTIDYGFGWGLEQNKMFGNITKHSGSWPGYRTYIERHIDNDKTIIFLENNDNSNTVNPVNEVRDILYNISPAKKIKVDLGTLQKYSGLYKTNKGTEKEFKIKNDKLYLVVNPTMELELIPTTSTKFTVKGFTPEVKIEFFEENGVVTKHVATQETRIVEAIKEE